MDEQDQKSFDLVTKEELFEGLKEIHKIAYSPLDDDCIWMDKSTNLQLYIDMLTSRC